MNTKLIMTASAVFTAIIGLGCSFLPKELLNYAGITELQLFPLIIQVLGSLYLGFAILNWMAKGNLIGGIYSKPVALGNFMHYFVGGMALIKYFINHQDMPMVLVPAVIYVLFALLFGKVAFGSPV
jgi:hypothetical protein